MGAMNDDRLPEVARQDFPEVSHEHSHQSTTPPHHAASLHPPPPPQQQQPQQEYQQQYQQPYAQPHQQPYPQPYPQHYQQQQQQPQHPQAFSHLYKPAYVKLPDQQYSGATIPGAGYQHPAGYAPISSVGTTSSPPPWTVGTATATPATSSATPVEKAGKGQDRNRLCGLRLMTLIWVLSIAVAVLAALVIGLAAGTGVEAGRASRAESEVRELKASLASATATASAAPTSTPQKWNSIDKGCTLSPLSTTNTTYESFKYLGSITFTIFCNSDLPGTPIMSLFAEDFDSCMDACSAFNQYIPKLLSGSQSSDNSTCEGVTFIPLWTEKQDALDGTAPGNCYFHPGPQSGSDLAAVTVGTEVHAAIVS